MRRVYSSILCHLNPTVLMATGLVFLPLMTAALVYWPGLTGTFLFDDFPNFATLSTLANTDSYTRAVHFIFSGDSGPTGRPVALASFLINDTAWPSEPWAFIYTNLMIHLLNGLLIFWFIYKLLITNKHTEKQSSIVASITCLIWLLHPLNVSTVLYVIQRMTELGTLFTLAGLISFIYGREFLRTQNRTAALWCLCAAYPFFGLVGIFSKEMAVTLLLYIVALEISVFQHQSIDKYKTLYKLWYRSFVLLPMVIVFGYLSSIYSLSGFNLRNFDLTERLLTESRILIDYLGQILFPRLAYGGLFHDDYTISTNLINPITTLLSIATLLVLLAASIKFRKRFPFYSLAGLWFLLGHVLESTFLPLELYFEHRNYLPMLAPLLALSYFVVTEGPRFRFVKYSGMALFAFLCIVYTTFNTTLWGKPRVAAVIWAKEHPASIRAQQAAASVFALAGRVGEGRKYLLTALKHHPLEAGLLLQVTHLGCINGNLTTEQLDYLQKNLPKATRSLAAVGVIGKLTNLAINNTCPPLNIAAMHNMINTLLNNSNFHSAKEQHALYYWRGQLFAARRQLEPAMEALDTSFKYHKAVEIPLQQAMWLHSAGLSDLAKKYIEIAKQHDRGNKNPLLNNSRTNDIDKVERKINRTLKIN